MEFYPINTAATASTNVTSLGIVNTGGTMGVLNGLMFAGNPNNQIVGGNIFQQYVDNATAPARPAKRKLKGLLANLRSEIDGWHGDVLERCPA